MLIYKFHCPVLFPGNTGPETTCITVGGANTGKKCSIPFKTVDGNTEKLGHCGGTECPVSSKIDGKDCYKNEVITVRKTPSCV